MRKLVLIIMATILISNINFAQGFFNSDGLHKAIKKCKSFSVKDLEKKLGVDCPKDILNAQYETVYELVSPELDTILTNYNEFSKKNSLKMHQNEFKLLDIDNDIRNVLKEFLGAQRDTLLEDGKEEKYISYSDKISHIILKKYYVPNLLTAATLYAGKWIKTEEQNFFIPFLKANTLHPKINDLKTLMSKQALEYLEKRLEDITKIASYMYDARDISQTYDVGNLKINYESDFNFEYISSLESIFNKILDGNKTAETDANNLPNPVIKDIKKHIENSTKFK